MSDPIVIPFGVPMLRAADVQIRDGKVTCPAPYVAIDPVRTEVLRLNGDQYAFPEPPDLRAMTNAAAQLAFLCAHLQHYCDLWARPPKLFLDRYFESVAAHVAANAADLAERLKPFGSLFAPEDWALSAPRPLPRAQLLAEGAYWPVDVAFWLGDHVLAVLLRGSATATARDEARNSALKRTGIEILELAAADLAQTDLCAVLPPAFRAFWAGQPMPSSPFKGTALDDIVPDLL